MTETFEQFRKRVTTPPRLRDSATGRYAKEADPETSQWDSGVDWDEIERVWLEYTTTVSLLREALSRLSAEGVDEPLQERIRGVLQ